MSRPIVSPPEGTPSTICLKLFPIQDAGGSLPGFQFLEVTPSGGILWWMKCSFQGRSRNPQRDSANRRKMEWEADMCFRTLGDESLVFRVDLIEHQLAHSVADPLGRAYNRTQFLDQRREMMQMWGDYLETL